MAKLIIPSAWHWTPRATSISPKAEREFRTFARWTLPGSSPRSQLGRALVRELRFKDAEAHILAGYAILTRQANPSVSYLQKAREDLVSVYDALHQPEKAKALRAEWSASAK
jgi:hypothetical protein